MVAPPQWRTPPLRADTTGSGSVFDETAAYYDAFYDAIGKDYRGEATAVLELIHGLNPGAGTLLDVACGTGRHIEVFSGELRCVGVDVSPDLLDVARRRCPDVVFVAADMVDLALDDRFDVVTCLFSSIGYVRTEARLIRAVRSMADHLDDGGVLVVEPSFQPDEWEVGHIIAVFVDEPELKAARIMRADRRDDVGILDFHYLLGEDAEVSYRRETHELGLFTWEQYVAAFEAAGLQVTVDRDGLIGRGLVIGVRT
jgi:SAM-dependent methyltransferase